jgi:Uma2 family endonuclease
MSLPMDSQQKYIEGKPLPMGLIAYEEFLHWAGGTFAEWVDGEVILLSPVSEPHADIVGFLSALMRLFVEKRKLGRVLTVPFQMHLHKAIERGREPDLMFIAKANQDRITHTYLDGPADLAIEVISPESVMRDRGEKYVEYEMEGVREYWIIDPDTKRADFFILSEENRYERAHEDAEGIYRSSVLTDFWIKVNWLWQSPMPDLIDVFTEMGASKQ